MDQNDAPDADTSGRVAILGTNVSVSTFAGAREFLAELVRRRGGAWIGCANAYSLALAAEDPRLRQRLNGAAFVMADGMPIVWALRLLGYDSERVHADDLLLDCCRRFPEWKHFLVGGRVGQVEIVAEEMRRRFSGIRIVGLRATPVRPVPVEDTESILEEIREASPDVVWVGMGTPAQDEWMTEAAPRAGVPMVGVGSVFDLLSGRTLPTPEWMKRSGLQWLFRLLQEPRRLMRRYFYYNLRFLIGFASQLTRQTAATRSSSQRTKSR